MGFFPLRQVKHYQELEMLLPLPQKFEARMKHGFVWICGLQLHFVFDFVGFLLVVLQSKACPYAEERLPSKSRGQQCHGRDAFRFGTSAAR